LQAAREWGNAWYSIHTAIHYLINQEIEKKYRTLDEKINKLLNTQTKKLENSTDLYLRVINKTNIIFSNEELLLLYKGLKFIPNLKQKQSLNNLAFEAENDIPLLPTCEQDYVRHQVAHNLQKLHKQQNEQPNSTNTKTKSENRVINQIKENLKMNKAINLKSR
jgi:hypothetical protein